MYILFPTLSVPSQITWSPYSASPLVIHHHTTFPLLLLLEMPRKIARSAKQNKVKLQEKRAIKRGDLLPEDATIGANIRPRHGPARSQVALRVAAASEDPDVAAASVNATHKIQTQRKLQSSFGKLSPEFLAEAKEKAATVPLTRPIPSTARHLDAKLIDHPLAVGLTCPKRPKWKYEMSKKEVEKNEEGLFTKWRQETTDKVDNWRSPPSEEVNPEGAQSQKGTSTKMLSPTYYEQNMEVWRQL